MLRECREDGVPSGGGYFIPQCPDKGKRHNGRTGIVISIGEGNGTSGNHMCIGVP